MKRILVVNQFNSENLGDKLLNLSLCDALKKRGIDILSCGYAQTTPQIMHYLCDNRKIHTLLHSLKRYLPNRLKYIIKYKRDLDKQLNTVNIKDCNGIVIGGGQLLKSKSVFLYCFQYWVKLSRKYKIPLYLYGIGIDDNLSAYEIKKYKCLISNVKYINCRDYFSYEFIKSRFDKECSLSPDIAFSYESQMIKSKENVIVMPYCYHTAVSAFSFLLSRQEYYQMLLEKAMPFILSGKRMIVTATTSADIQESYKFIEWINKKNIEMEMKYIYSIEMFENLFSSAECIISGRMHALIMGKIMDANIIPIEISQKIKQFAYDYNTHEFDLNIARKKSLDGIDLLVANFN